ncbi:unnamed protein product [Callosobruchus maculatus]|uniref:Uncharacterized protein n=1 Tax=Callosobruchus maculatus TaxID=64391 RepID=A0A653CKK4_CALMS|nr:unnamed protein product [Callosobruchus maculatus]
MFICFAIGRQVPNRVRSGLNRLIPVAKNRSKSQDGHPQIEIQKCMFPTHQITTTLASCKEETCMKQQLYFQIVDIYVSSIV